MRYTKNILKKCKKQQKTTKNNKKTGGSGKKWCHFTKRGWCRKLPTSRYDFETSKSKKRCCKYKIPFDKKQIFNAKYSFFNISGGTERSEERISWDNHITYYYNRTISSSWSFLQNHPPAAQVDIWNRCSENAGHHKKSPVLYPLFIAIFAEPSTVFGANATDFGPSRMICRICGHGSHVC